MQTTRAGPKPTTLDDWEKVKKKLKGLRKFPRRIKVRWGYFLYIGYLHQVEVNSETITLKTGTQDGQAMDFCIITKQEFLSLIIKK